MIVAVTVWGSMLAPVLVPVGLFASAMSLRLIICLYKVWCGEEPDLYDYIAVAVVLPLLPELE